VVVEKGALVKDSIVMSDCIIGEGTVIENAIIDENVRIGKNSVIGEKKITCIGKDVVIPDTIRIGAGCVVWPFTRENAFKEKNIAPGTTVGGEEI
jgi:glucose-1-phosphate adenylyltransferase